MPKKKLTKAQVNKKLITIRKAMMTLFLDKMEYGSASHLPMSMDKMGELHKSIASTILRVK
tara:strand:- start:42 stop:224 length:183 start_codon:yes stop_codon:yes gene_type:complete